MGEEYNDELVKTAKQIIMNAGDARVCVKEAMNAAKRFDFSIAEEKMSAAKHYITLAHKSQTEIIQNEASGLKYHHSLLFTHAQDTLMTIMSEIQLSEQLIDILKIIEKK